MEYRLSEEKCLEILKTLAERYAAPSVQYELKMATYDHSFEMTKGFIQRARKVMWPLQRDLLLDAGFLSPEDDASGDDHARSRAPPARPPPRRRVPEPRGRRERG